MSGLKGQERNGHTERMEGRERDRRGDRIWPVEGSGERMREEN